MKPARHWYRGDDHAMTECSPERCGLTTEKAEAYARTIRSLNGDCACGRVIGPRCFDGRMTPSCPERS